MAFTDPTGILLKRQGMDTFLANKDEQRRADYGPGGSAIDQAVHMTGPLPDPQWQAFFQALQNQGVSKITGGRTDADRVREAEPTNQIRGTSAQPDYFTGGDTFRGYHTTPYGAADPEYTKYAGRVAITPPQTDLGRSILALRHRALPHGDADQLRRLYNLQPWTLSGEGDPGGGR